MWLSDVVYCQDALHRFGRNENNDSVGNFPEETRMLRRILREFEYRSGKLLVRLPLFGSYCIFFVLVVACATVVYVATKRQHLP